MVRDYCTYIYTTQANRLVAIIDRGERGFTSAYFAGLRTDGGTFSHNVPPEIQTLTEALQYTIAIARLEK